MAACFSRISLATAGMLVVAICHAQQRLPLPVLPQPIVHEDVPPSLVRMAEDPFANPGPPPHLVLREHAPPHPSAPLGAAQHHRPHGPHQTVHHWQEKLSHAVKKDRAHVTGRRASVPQATTQLRQKTPYSYGYFGASNKRHWSLHYGSRQNAIRWTKH